MPRASRSRSACLALLVGCLLAVAWAPATAAAGSAPTRVTRTTVVDTVAPTVSGGSFERHAPKRHTTRHRASYLWPGRRITYFEALPAKWHWSLVHAVSQWNRLGGGIKFVRTTNRSRARLTIGYGRIGGSAGLATVGRTRHASVRLSAGYSTKDAFDAHNRIEVMAVLSHELGHVLGFEHTRTRCSLMSPVLDVDGCGDVSAAHPGYYKCRTVDVALASRFVHNYGGRVRPAGARWCLIDPLPSVLSGVAFTDASDTGVSISWARPSYAPAGSHVVIEHWDDDACATPPVWAASDYADARAGTWEYPDSSSATDNCYRVELVNRYGAGRTTTGTTFARTVPSVQVNALGSPATPTDPAPPAGG